nr:PREDICTED: mucin-19-like [Lepisosteus oculatus]
MKLLSELTLVAVFFLLSGVCKTFGSGSIKTFSDFFFYVKSTCPFTFSKKGTDYDIRIQRDEDGLLVKVIIFLNGVETILENGKINVQGTNVNLPYDHKYLHIHKYGIYTKLESRVMKLSVFWYDADGYISSFWLELDQNRHGETDGLCGRYNTPVEPTCPGDLIFNKNEKAFMETCSNPVLPSDVPYTKTCICPTGKVLNDLEGKNQCVELKDCPCVYAGNVYPAGYNLETKCQKCVCKDGKWDCSQKKCPSRCKIEGIFVTTFDGKNYRIPGRCQYFVAQGLNWTLTVEFLENQIYLSSVKLELYKELYEFSISDKTNLEKYEFYQSEHLRTFRRSSMYIQVQTSFGLKMQIQVSPLMQLYLTLPEKLKGTTQGLCGNYNDDIRDEFTSSSGIVENSVDEFANSWMARTCEDKTPQICTNTLNDLYGKENCGYIMDPTGPFAKCHDHVQYDSYIRTCEESVCQCAENVQDCLCTALGNYAKACAAQGIIVEDWRKDDCIVSCPKNQKFEYIMTACNRTCRSLSVYDFTCEVEDDPVEGCGCSEGSHMDDEQTCTSTFQCPCYHGNDIYKRGTFDIAGYQSCNCEDGRLDCNLKQSKKRSRTNRHFIASWVRQTRCQLSLLCRPKLVVTVSREQLKDISILESLKHLQGVVTRRWSVGTLVPTSGHPAMREAIKKASEYGLRWEVSLHLFKRYRQAKGAAAAAIAEVKTHLWEELGPISEECQSGCYCPEGKYEDHNGNCVSREDCTCTYSGEVFKPGTNINLHCKKCICEDGKWNCVGNDCSGKCQVYGDGHYQTFDLKSYRFDGNCEYTLVEDDCGNGKGTFEIKAESVPCCDEALTCSRAIVLDIKDQVTLKLSEMNVTINSQNPNSCVDPRYYFDVCLQESCSCEFDGKFLGFCTAVAAYAEACSEEGVCIQWRTPDLCPVYCDYYNVPGECSWHYEPCGTVPTCGKNNRFAGKLEGCYPRCPDDAPYFDENKMKCSSLQNCSCFYNETIIEPNVTVENCNVKCIYNNTNNNINNNEINNSALSAFSLSAFTARSKLPDELMHNNTNNHHKHNINNYTNINHNNINNNSNNNHINNYTNINHNYINSNSNNYVNNIWNTRSKIVFIFITIIEQPYSCPQTVKPVCPRNSEPKKITDGYCKTWDCDCLCEVFGDPHYVTFSGTRYEFLENCTYTLVEEKIPKYNFSVAVDNYYCISGSRASCAKGIILRYEENTVALTIVNKVIVSTFNKATVKPPYESNGIRLLTTENIVMIFIDKIRSTVSLTPRNRVEVKVAMQYFKNNTQGQCGVCGGSSCVRRHGETESDSCCDKTAYDWLYDDPQKPYCKSAPQNISCTTHLKCPNGTVFHECRNTTDGYCQGTERKSGEYLKEFVSGCFCPDNMLHAEKHKDICVSDCSNCKGPLGEPKKTGETWETNCHICTCSNITNTEECTPKEIKSPPACKDNEILVTYNATGCCQMQYCVEKTCEYGGVKYKVGDEWKDYSKPCNSYVCQKSGITTKTKMCPAQNCPEDQRILDSDKCCYMCNETCYPKKSTVDVTVDNCIGQVEMTSCEGHCESQPQLESVGGIFRMKQTCHCCLETSIQTRNATLNCDLNTPKLYSYKYITGCKCLACT